jgi:hypothetical protein
MAQPAVIPVKTGQKVPSVFGQWKAVITIYLTMGCFKAFFRTLPAYFKTVLGKSIIVGAEFT